MSDKSTNNSNSGYLVPMIIIAGLFFVFGFVIWINGALIPFMQSLCELTATESLLVATASYISFCVMALPASYVLKKIGYRRGMSLGLFIIACGAIVFIPAAASRTYAVFLTGLFIQGAGMTLLQTAANPYITIIGPIESAARRISIMGICNKGAGALGSIIFGALLLSGIDELQAKLQVAEQVEKESLLTAMASNVVMPYITMASILVLLSVLILFAPLPDIEAKDDDKAKEESASIFQFPHLFIGVLALFVYVGAEVIAGDTIIAYGISLGLSGEESSYFTSFTLGAMILGYLVGAMLIPKVISQGLALRGSAVLGVVFTVCIVFTSGFTSVLFVAALGLANALVWPAIWPLALKGLGKFTKTGSAFLVMGISGGAIVPLLYGALVDGKKETLLAKGLSISDASAGAATSGYWVLIPCYVIIFYFAVWGHKLKSKKEAMPIAAKSLAHEM